MKTQHGSNKLIRLALVLAFILPSIFSAQVQTAHAAGNPLKVVGRFLQDVNGNDIMLRGVNVPVYHSGYVDDLNAVAQAVATTKVNVVRLEWWANPQNATFYTVNNLDLAIQKYVDLGILPMIELHDLTYQYGHNTKNGANSDGNDQALFASTITAFWTRADVLPILIKHQSHLIINLANEWGSAKYDDDSSTATNFIQNYTAAITAMRTAGINAPLVVDAPAGFEYQFMLDNGQAILNADPQSNTMLSIHAYWAASGYSDAAIDTILTNIQNSGLPILLGEVSSNAWTNIQCDPVHYPHLLTSANTAQIGYIIWAWYEDGTCGQAMNITANQDGVTIPAAPSFGDDVLNGSGYGINTALPITSPVATTVTNGSKVLITNRAIATWPGNVPVAEKRPVLVFLPGWDGTGAVNASVSAQNLLLVNEGYVTLAIGFDSSATWISDIEVKTKAGLDLLCADASIPANCDAITLVGASYGSAQNYWVIEYIRSHGYSGGTGSAIGFLSEDSGYGAPGDATDANGGYNRTGLADTASYSVGMIENLGDTTFPVDDCTWGNCGARTLADAHAANGDTNVFSICPAGGNHGTRGFANWNVWVISALKTMIHSAGGIATFTGYTAPTLTVTNACTTALTQSGYALEVNSAHGTITQDINQASYQDGDVIQLTATPNTGWSFVNWTGDLTSSSNPDSVTIHGNTVITANYAAITSTVTLNSIAAQDGWMLELSENSNTGGSINASSGTFIIGDNAARQQYRGLLSFDTGSLPDMAVITGLALNVKKASIVGGGNPVTALQGFMVDIKKGMFGTATLQPTDFQTAPTKSYGPFLTGLASGWYSIDLTAGKAYINKAAASSGLTQIRLRFKLDDNNNAVANFLSLYSGSAAAASRPQLVVTYYVP